MFLLIWVKSSITVLYEGIVILDLFTSRLYMREILIPEAIVIKTGNVHAIIDIKK